MAMEFKVYFELHRFEMHRNSICGFRTGLLFDRIKESAHLFVGGMLEIAAMRHDIGRCVGI